MAEIQKLRGDQLKHRRIREKRKLVKLKEETERVKCSFVLQKATPYIGIRRSDKTLVKKKPEGTEKKPNPKNGTKTPA